MLFELDIQPRKRPLLYRIASDDYNELREQLADVITQVSDMRGNVIMPVIITKFRDDMDDVWGRIESNMIYLAKWWDDMFIMDVPTGVSFSINSQYEEVGRSYISSYMIYNIIEFGRKYSYAGDHFTELGNTLHCYALNTKESHDNFTRFTELYKSIDNLLIPLDIQWFAATDYFDQKRSEYEHDVERIRREVDGDY